MLEAFRISRARGEAIRLTPVVFVPFVSPEGTLDKYDPYKCSTSALVFFIEQKLMTHKNVQGTTSDPAVIVHSTHQGRTQKLWFSRKNTKLLTHSYGRPNDVRDCRHRAFSEEGETYSVVFHKSTSKWRGQSTAACACRAFRISLSTFSGQCTTTST